MSSYEDLLAEDLRLGLLKLLKAAGGSVNENALLPSLKATGHPRLTKDALRLELEWLREHGLVLVTWFDGKLAVAKLTQRGLDVAEGAVTVDGVRRPSIVG